MKRFRFYFMNTKFLTLISLFSEELELDALFDLYDFAKKGLQSALQRKLSNFKNQLYF